MKFFALLGVLGGLGLTACGEKKTNAPEPTEEPEKEVAVQAPAEEPAPAPAPKPAGDALAARAEALGFAKYLPDTTQGYLGVFDGKGFIDELRKSKLMKFLEARAEEEGGINLDEMEENPEAAMFLSLVSEEVVVAVGKGTPAQAKNLVTLNEAGTVHQMKFLVKMFEARMTGEELDGPGGMGMNEMMLPMVGGFLRDPAAGIALLENAQMPPLTIAFKVSDEDARNNLVGMAQEGLNGLLEQGGPDGAGFLEAVKIERGDSTLTGVKVIGEKLAGMIGDAEREQMSEMMDAASIEKIVKLIETKNILVAVGTHGDYLVGFAGTDPEEFQIPASPAESIVGSSELAFVDSYTDKKLLAVVTMSQELQARTGENVTILGSAAKGLKAGLADAEAFGDTRDLEVLLDLVAKEEAALLKMQSYTPAGVVAYLEDGLKLESYGGSNMPDLDLDTPHKYAAVGQGEGLFLFANWVSDGEYAEKSLEYLDSVGETIYLGAKQFSSLEIEDPSVEQFKEGFGMFDQTIRPHLLELWGALRGDLTAGLGNEGAIVIDLAGEVPPIPGLPQEVVDEGKAPRIGVVAPVEDREKISGSWKRIDQAVRGLLEIASEMSGEEIPMQRPMSSEKDDLKTWFMPFPFQSDDFVLSVSIDPKNFFLSTSKSYVQSLSATLAEAEADPARKGAYLTVDFEVLNAYLTEWVGVVEKHSGAMFGEGSPAEEDFKQQLPMIKEVITALSELKSFDAHTRKEGGTVRTSIHFKTGS